MDALLKGSQKQRRHTIWAVVSTSYYIVVRCRVTRNSFFHSAYPRCIATQLQRFVFREKSCSSGSRSWCRWKRIHASTLTRIPFIIDRITNLKMKIFYEIRILNFMYYIFFFLRYAHSKSAFEVVSWCDDIYYVSFLFNSSTKKLCFGCVEINMSREK